MTEPVIKIRVSENSVEASLDKNKGAELPDKHWRKVSRKMQTRVLDMQQGIKRKEEENKCIHH